MMFSSLRLAIVAALVITGHAAPSPRPLYPRAISFVDCSATQKAKINTALSDAADLASLATGIDRKSAAFTHYLRDVDGKSAVAMWTQVAANKNPSSALYSFTFRCAKKCPAGSLAITDSTPQSGTTPREMMICPPFFTDKETKNDLNSKTYTPGKRGSWCQTGQRLADFLTAGHTLLHEMTHLDAVGLAAGAPAHTDATGFTTHGTDDVDGFGNDYVKAARAFLSAWVNNPGSLAPGAIAPWQNAENLAASATEWWFNKKCGFTNIVI